MPPKAAPRGEYIETPSGNKISRRALIHGMQHVGLAGKCVIQQDVVIRGDLVRQTPPSAPPGTAAAAGGSAAAPSTTNAISIHLGRYVFISPHVTLHPPSRLASTNSSSSSSTTTNPPTQTATQTVTYYPLRISDHVFIGPHSTIQAAQIGTHVHIGANVHVGNMVIIKDHVRVEDGTVLAAGSVWASGSVVAGRPGRVVGELGEGWAGVEGGPGAQGRECWGSVGGGARR